MVPVAILNVHLALFNYGGLERWVEHRNLGEDLDALVILLPFFENFRSPEEGLQLLRIAALVLVEDLFEVGQAFLL